MTMAEAINLMTNETQYKLMPNEATLCYGLSLQTCSSINKNLERRMKCISLLEFKELIGRFAEMVIQDDRILVDKIDTVLDNLLPLAG